MPSRIGRKNPHKYNENHHPTAMSVVASNLELEEKSSIPMWKELPDKRVFFDMGFFIFSHKTIHRRRRNDSSKEGAMVYR